MSTAELEASQANHTAPKSEKVLTAIPRFKRQYYVVETFAGLIRLQTITAGELVKVRDFPPAQQYYAAIALSMVDENGDTCHPCTPAGFAHFKDMDAQVFDILVDAINQKILNSKPIEELVKN